MLLKSRRDSIISSCFTELVFPSAFTPFFKWSLYERINLERLLGDVLLLSYPAKFLWSTQTKEICKSRRKMLLSCYRKELFISNYLFCHYKCLNFFFNYKYFGIEEFIYPQSFSYQETSDFLLSGFVIKYISWQFGTLNPFEINGNLVLNSLWTWSSFTCLPWLKYK